MSGAFNRDGRHEEALDHDVVLPASPNIVNVGPAIVSLQSTLYIHVNSDVDTDLTVLFSNNGINYAQDQVIPMLAHGLLGDIHKITVKGKWIRLILANLTGSPSTVFTTKTYAIPN